MLSLFRVSTTLPRKLVELVAEQVRDAVTHIVVTGTEVSDEHHRAGSRSE